VAIQPYQLPYSDSAVQNLRERLARTRWPDTIPGSGWEYGFDLEYLQRICRYWREEFDWKAEIEMLLRLHHLQFKWRHRAPHASVTSHAVLATCGFTNPILKLSTFFLWCGRTA